MYLKHPAWLWLKNKRKELLPPPTTALQALFEAGHEYERFAEPLFAGGLRLGFDNYQQYLTLPERTRTALANGADTIFQGRFEHRQTTCIVDVLKRVGDGTFDLFEIKSGTSVKAGNEFFKRNPFTDDRRCDMAASCARKRAELTAPTWRAQANEGAAP